MKLYMAPYAPNPRRVSMFLAEKGITDIAIELLDLPAGQHRTPEYRAKSPLSHVPALELDDGTCLTESRAICLYLESLYPEPNLFGQDAKERALIEMWDRRIELGLALPFMMWVRHGHPGLSAVEKNQCPEMAAWYENSGKRMAAWLNERLASHTWIMGERFSNADITAAAGMDFAKMLKWRPGEDLPHLAAWRARFGERPAGKAPA